jgi:serine/threonine protein kinase
VMELAEGKTLSETIKRGPLSIDLALQAAFEMALGLQAIH